MPNAPRLDDTDPALPALRLEAFPSPSQSLIVLTRDPQLVETLRNVAIGHSVATVEAEADLAGQLMQAQGGVALIDAAAVTSPVTGLTERLKAQFPDLVLVVAGSAEDQSALTAQITRGMVYRFLHKPLSEQRVKLFVAAAWRRHGEEHAGIIGAARTQPTRTLPVARLRTRWWVAITAGIAILGIAGWLAMRQSPRPAEPTATSTAPAPPQISPQRTIERAVLQTTAPPPAAAPPIAETAVARLPPSASTVATPEPAPADSSVEVTPSTLATRIVSEAHNALAEGKIDEAERLIPLAAEAGADEEDVNDLLRKTRELRIAARGGAMTRTSQLFNERLAQGKLLEPADDSAKHYLDELVATDAEHPSTRIARDAYAARLVQEARKFSTEDLAAARRWLAEARAAGADESAITGIEKDIVAAQESAKVDEIVSSASLNKLLHVDPEYPPLARSRELNGWVDLELIVRTDGSVGNVAVMRAEPADIFDKAAIDAARQWRYEPVQRDGKPVEQRTRVRIRFQLK